MATPLTLCFFLFAVFLTQGSYAELSTTDAAEEEEPLKFHPRFARTANSANKEKSKEESDECAPPPHHPHSHPPTHPHKPPPECCKGLIRTCNPAEDKEVWETCFAKVPKKPQPTEATTEASGGKPGRGPMFGMNRQCIIECVYNETGLLTPEMKLQETKISQKLNDKLKDTKFASIAPSVMTKCFANAKNVTSSKECKSGAGEFAKCVSRELFMSCPAENWNNSEECQKIKEKLTKCPNMPVPMGPPPKP